MLIPLHLEQFLTFPEPTRKRFRVEEELKAGRSVIWVFPDRGFVRSIIRLLEAELADVHLKVGVLDVRERDGWPGEIIAQEYGVSPLNAPVNPVQLITAEQLPEVLVVEGIDDCSKEIREVWQQFLILWSHAAKTVAEEGEFPRALLIPVADAEYARCFQTDLYLVVH